MQPRTPMASLKNPPNLLDSCEAILPLDPSPQVVRFSQFTLFNQSKPPNFGPPRLLVLQPQRIIQASDALEASFRKRGR